jgi:hypothetical protein
MKHIVLATGLHCITDKKGAVHVYTENEYTYLEWWIKIKIKYDL